MNIVSLLAHASWQPHKSNFDDAIEPTENDASRQITQELFDALKKTDPSIRTGVVEICDYYKCDGSCGGKQSNCPHYCAGLVRAVKKTKQADLALSFHLDFCKNNPGRKGPLALVSGTYASKLFASTWLDSFEKISGYTRRGRAPTSFDGIGYNGVFPMDKSKVANAFGGNYFLQNGAKNAVLIEVGCASNPQTVERLINGDLIRCAAYAATVATITTKREVKQWK